MRGQRVRKGSGCRWNGRDRIYGWPSRPGQDPEELLPSTGLMGQGEEREPDNCWASCEGTQPGHGDLAGRESE